MDKNELTYIELLSPARDYLCGKAAIDHGADAVYIGAPQFGARSAASNSIGEIENLVNYAHLFRIKVYAALNTILYDHEMEDAKTIIHSLYNVGIDGIIIQDMGLLQLNLPPVPLIASTQTHNNSPEKIRFIEAAGFTRVILARELSLPQITDIRMNTTIELECFIHGALCVSYSGQCYMSESVCGRSGNRGQCAQPCRSTYNLIDGNGKTVIRNKHLLSLKDLNLSDYIGKLMDAGIGSFKIEGRLKDSTYVKNITSYYRNQIDRELEKRSGSKPSSSGKIYHFFAPDPERSFNRGFTSYFINGRKEKTGSPNTQKSIGKRLGYITEKALNWLKVDNEDVSNGDGLCFFGNDDVLYGFAAQKVSGNKIFTDQAEILEKLAPGIEIFRNHDQKFEKLLQNTCAERKIGVSLTFNENPNGFSLHGIDEDNNETTIMLDSTKTPAKNQDLALKSFTDQLERFGGSIFECHEIQIKTDVAYFFPVSVINGLRREFIAKHALERIKNYKKAEQIKPARETIFIQSEISYLANVSNKFAEQFYRRSNVVKIEPALELSKTYSNRVVMTTKHCIRYQFDACPVYQKGKSVLSLPLYLEDNHHTYRLDFDCKKCEMLVIFEK